MTIKTPKEGVVVAVDVDNLLLSAAASHHLACFGQQCIPQISLLCGFMSMFSWIKSFGNILCVHLYLPVSQCINYEEIWHALYESSNIDFPLEMVFCPRRPEAPGQKPDNVDAHLINHSRWLMDVLKAKYFCLASGDLDYSPMLADFKRRGIEIAFAVGSKKSFSSAYLDACVPGKNPCTGENLVHMFSLQKQQV